MSISYCFTTHNIYLGQYYPLRTPYQPGSLAKLYAPSTNPCGLQPGPSAITTRSGKYNHLQNRIRQMLTGMESTSLLLDQKREEPQPPHTYRPFPDKKSSNQCEAKTLVLPSLV